MAEYIEREAVKKMLENAQIISNGEYSGYCTEDINIDDIPAADVAPVMHGGWEYVDGDEFSETYKCSVCGYDEVVCVEIYNDDLPPHCPNCGADMRKVR